MEMCFQKIDHGNTCRCKATDLLPPTTTQAATDETPEIFTLYNNLIQVEVRRRADEHHALVLDQDVWSSTDQGPLPELTPPSHSTILTVEMVPPLLQLQNLHAEEVIPLHLATQHLQVHQPVVASRLQ